LPRLPSRGYAPSVPRSAQPHANRLGSAAGNWPGRRAFAAAPSRRLTAPQTLASASLIQRDLPGTAPRLQRPALQHPDIRHQVRSVFVAVDIESARDGGEDCEPLYATLPSTSRGRSMWPSLLAESKLRPHSRLSACRSATSQVRQGPDCSVWFCVRSRIEGPTRRAIMT